VTDDAPLEAIIDEDDVDEVVIHGAEKYLLFE
jgi:hypothetical protein